MIENLKPLDVPESFRPAGTVLSFSRGEQSHFALNCQRQDGCNYSTEQRGQVTLIRTDQWLIDHGVPRRQIDKQTTKVFPN